MIVFFNSIGGVALDENGNPQYYEAFIKWITGESKIKTSRVTNIILTRKDDRSNVAMMIMTFDENDICIGARYCIEEETREEAMEKYERYRELEESEIPALTNVRIEGKKLIYNHNYWNRKTKEEIKRYLLDTKYDSHYLIEEI